MIIMFAGIPACGKTTIAQCVTDRLSELGTVQMINSDKLRPPVYKKIFRAIGPHPDRARFLVLDATFGKREQRQQVRALAQDEPVITVYLECPLQLALERNKTRHPNISERALHIVYHRFEPPENPTIRIDTTTTSAAEACAMIVEVVRKSM
jgi:bifunctional enzyme CysN/CysC